MCVPARLGSIRGLYTAAGPLSRLEVEALRRAGLPLRLEQLRAYCNEVGLTSARERAQFTRKLAQMGLLEEEAPASYGPAGA